MNLFINLFSFRKFVHKVFFIQNKASNVIIQIELSKWFSKWYSYFIFHYIIHDYIVINIVIKMWNRIFQLVKRGKRFSMI